MATAKVSQEVIPSVVSRIREIMASDPTRGLNPDGAWDLMWKEGATPWDSAGIQPALRELVEERWGEVEGVDWASLVDGGKGRALVAGCGRGYDAIYFAAQGFDALGADHSSTAIEAAKTHLAAFPNAPTTVRFERVDFFSELPPSTFSLCYDYTFFCAIPPDLRQKWADSYAAAIRPGGVLIALQWPIVGDRPGGPPFSVSPEAYEEVLNKSFTRAYFGSPKKTTKGHEGFDKMSVWKRK